MESALSAREMKLAAKEIFAGGTFELQKWHSSVPELESPETSQSGGDETFAKQQLGRRCAPRFEMGQAQTYHKCSTEF